MKRLSMTLLPLLALGTALPVAATTIAVTAPSTGPVRLELLDRDSGRVLPQHAHAGQRWVAGERGHRYAVRLHNDSGERVLVVLSVDGINAISGEEAAPSQTGYVLRPWQQVDIAGWRKSNEEIAQFVFSSPGDSYAARTGRAENLGVVGIAVFKEHRLRPHLPPTSPPLLRELRMPQAGARQESSGGTGVRAAAAPAPAQRLGTGHGQRETSVVRDTNFKRAGLLPDQMVQLRYDSARNLRTRGIAVDAQVPAEQGPQAFPRRYVPDPPRR